MFISVTGLFSRRVTAGAPLAYEPPTIEIFAVCAVTETRWNSAWTDGSVELASGKSLPTATEYSVPLTEMTAVPGLGALALPPDDEDEPLLPLEPEWADGPAAEGAEEDVAGLSLSCWANGSLLANRLKDDSWPSATGGADADASEEPDDGVEMGAWLPPSVGAARVGVPVVVPAGFSL